MVWHYMNNIDVVERLFLGLIVIVFKPLYRTERGMFEPIKGQGRINHPQNRATYHACTFSLMYLYI